MDEILERYAPVPAVVLYGKPGCGLCDDARENVTALLDERAARGQVVPRLVERDITTNPAWERAFFLTIPVIELGNRRVELATSLARVRELLATLDAPVQS